VEARAAASMHYTARPSRLNGLRRVRSGVRQERRAGRGVLHSGPAMHPPSICQACRSTVSQGLLSYKRGADVIHRESLLQCDVCERFACSSCLQVYDILSGYDFLCRDCARQLLPPAGTVGH